MAFGLWSSGALGRLRGLPRAELPHRVVEGGLGQGEIGAGGGDFIFGVGQLRQRVEDVRMAAQPAFPQVCGGFEIALGAAKGSLAHLQPLADVLHVDARFPHLEDNLIFGLAEPESGLVGTRLGLGHARLAQPPIEDVP